MSRTPILLTILILLAGTLATSTCKSPAAPSTDPPLKNDPSFSGDIQPIFTASCALSACHGTAAQAGLSLNQGSAYGNLVNVVSTSEPPKKRVLPGDAENSYIVIKLEGRQTVGAQMPQGASLRSNSLQNIKNWINMGAKNN